MKEYRGAVCKGSYMLGSACGHCERCHNEASEMAALHKDAVKTVNRAANKLQLAEAALQVIALSMPAAPPVKPALIADANAQSWHHFGANTVAVSAASIALAALNHMKAV